jgi:K+-transporting ATPase c subunit
VKEKNIAVQPAAKIPKIAAKIPKITVACSNSGLDNLLFEMGSTLKISMVATKTQNPKTMIIIT